MNTPSFPQSPSSASAAFTLARNPHGRLVLTLADQPQLMADVPRDHPARTGDTVGVRIAPERLMPCHETSD